MSIEALLTSLKEAIDKNTEALKAGPAAGSAPAATTGGKGKGGKASAPEISQEQCNAALIKIKDDFGLDEAKKVIKEFGGVEKMGEIKPAKWAAVYEAAVARHAELTAGNPGGDDEI